jgi:hypothetical protein
MSKLNSDDYPVGYGKPPASTQFRKGQSGNRSGRPKGTNNLKTDLLEELREKVTLKEGERTKRHQTACDGKDPLREGFEGRPAGGHHNNRSARPSL